MSVRRAIVIAAGVAAAAMSFPLAAAAAASASTPTVPVVDGVITGLHTFALAPGETVVLGEILHPNLPAYAADVPVVGISTYKGVTTVTTGFTFLPLNQIGKPATFTVIRL
jgi:hypothetical protein